MILTLRQILVILAATAKSLQNAIGDRPKVVKTDFANWSQRLHVEGVFKISPTTVQEIQKVVRENVMLENKTV